MAETRMHIDDAKEELRRMECEFGGLPESSGDPAIREHRNYLKFRIDEYRTAIEKFEAEQ